MMDEYLSRIEGHIKDIKNLLGKLDLGVLFKDPEFETLKALFSEGNWPPAENAALFHDESSHHQRMVRADAILDLMCPDPIVSKKFLNIGKDLDLVVAAGTRGAQVSNYNPDQPKSWLSIESKGPYDVILLYDVLDHSEDPGQLLQKVRRVSTPASKIVVRCHPWCSRTATHLYDVMNKAYLHLVFSEVELVRLGIGLGEPTFKVIHPHLTYRSWFKSAGFDVVVEDSSTAPIEPFFTKTPLVAKRIKSNWSNSHEHELASGRSFPTFQLQMQFVDYRLKA